MANNWYATYKQNLLAGTTGYDIDRDDATDGPFCALVDSAIYSYNATTDGFYAVTASAVDAESATAGTPQRITGPIVTLGVFDGSDLTYTAVAAGPDLNALVIYRHSASANTSWPLVLYLDTSISGLPVVPNGGNITVTWSGSGIARLGSAPA